MTQFNSHLVVESEVLDVKLKDVTTPQELGVIRVRFQVALYLGSSRHGRMLRANVGQVFVPINELQNNMSAS